MKRMKIKEDEEEKKDTFCNTSTYSRVFASPYNRSNEKKKKRNLYS